MKKKQLSSKTLAVFLTALMLLSFLPIAVLGWYDVPSADDFSMGLQAGVMFRQTGNIFATIAAGFQKTLYLYRVWIGYYASSFLSALPPQTWGEPLYCVTPLLCLVFLSLGTAAVLRVFLECVFRADRYLIISVTAVVLMVTVHCLPRGAARMENLYWYSGAVNYTVMYGVALCWIAMMLRGLLDAEKKCGIPWLIGACVLGFIAAGANYMTALTGAILAVSMILWILLFCRGRMPLILPCAVYIAGFILSCIAPGNRIRGELSEGIFSPLQAILESLRSTIVICMGQWTRLPVLLALLFLIPLFWNAAERIRIKPRLPLLFALYTFGLASANITPPLYAKGNMDSGRLLGLFWMQYFLLLVLTEGYLIGWLRNRAESKKSADGETGEARNPSSKQFEGLALKWMLAVAAAFAVFSLVRVGMYPAYYTGSQAIQGIVSGEPQIYRREFYKRLEKLRDPSQTDVRLAPYSVRPELLFYEDIKEDPDDWINGYMAEYYGKASVAVVFQ